MLIRKIGTLAIIACLIPSLTGFTQSSAHIGAGDSESRSSSDSLRTADDVPDTKDSAVPSISESSSDSTKDSLPTRIKREAGISDKQGRAGRKVEKYTKTLRAGMTGEVITSLQEGLKQYFPDESSNLSVTGTFDSATTQALKRIQRTHGIYPDGTYGMQTAHLAYEKGMVLWILPHISSSTALSFGQHSSRISALQSWLFYTFGSSFKECEFKKIDGIYGNVTRSCIIRVARKYSLPEHGAVDNTIADGLVKQGIDIDIKAPSAINDIIVTHVLSRGARGKDVLSIQTFLHYYFPHYASYQPDGTFGNLTKQSLWRFQKAHSISPDGSYGFLTAEVIRRFGVKTWILPKLDISWNLVKRSAYSYPVKIMQSWLAYAFPHDCPLKTHGVFDQATEQCVNKVRRYYSLPENGLIDPELSKYLVKDGYRLYVKEAPTPWRSFSTSLLRYGNKGTTIKDIQIALNKHFPEIAGFYPDGSYGAKTQAAIKALQRRHGIHPDGIVGLMTSKIFARHNIPITIVPPTYFFHTLKVGSSGNAVLAMQLGLRHFYPSECSFIPDGQFGSITEQCLYRVQKKNGISADGKFGAITSKLLQKHGVPITLVGYRAPNGYLQPTSYITRLGGRTNSLTWGMNGVKVKIVQKRLGIWGTHTLASVDSRFQQAVRTYQRRAGVSADGVVGRKTWNALHTGYSWTVDQYQATPLSLTANRSQRIDRLVKYALAQRGTSYTWGGAGYSSLGFDCSGLVLQSLYAAGLDPQPIDVIKHAWPSYRTSRQLYAHPKLKHVPLSQRQRGDLVFYQKGGTVFHVGIYLGNNQVVHTDWMGRPARVQNIALNYGWSAISPTVVRPFP